MNHEILFRGRCCDSGSWHEGMPVRASESPYRICAIDIPDKRTCVQIDPETCGEYTGLTDKNGRRIFEGDIIEYEEKYGIARYSVVWNEKAACFSVAGYNGMIIGDFSFYASNKCEVIGNIHNNLELLGGG